MSEADLSVLEVDPACNLRLKTAAALCLADRAVSLIHPLDPLVAAGTYYDTENRERHRIGDVMWWHTEDPQSVDYWFNNREAFIILDALQKMVDLDYPVDGREADIYLNHLQFLIPTAEPLPQAA